MSESETKVSAPTKESSIPITPLIKSLSVSALESPSSPQNPLFSREDFIEIHKSKRQLEMDVAALEHRYRTLQNEVKQTRRNMVSFGELTLLKAQTRSAIANDQSLHIKQLMDEFVSSIRAVRASQASLSILDQKVSEESEHRTLILEENSAIQNALNFSDIKFRVPELNSLTRNLVEVSSFELERSKNHLFETHNEIASMEGARRWITLQSTAAVEMSRSTESECNLRMVGTATLRNEIQTHQRLISSQDLMIRKFDADIESERRRIEKRKLELHDERLDHENRMKAALESFNQQIALLTAEEETLKSRLAESALLYDKINDEKRIIESRFNSLTMSVDDIEDSDEEMNVTQVSLTDESTSLSLSQAVSNEEERLLRERKAELEREIYELKTQFRITKEKGKKKESKIKNKITKLHDKYSYVKALLDKKSKKIQLAHNANSSSSDIYRNIEDLVHKIEFSVQEAKFYAK